MWYFKTIVFTLMIASFGAAHGQVDERQLLSATPNLGVVTRATVNFYKKDGTTLLRTGNTGQRGFVRVNVGSYDDPVVVEILGNNVARYYDEAAGTSVPFRAGSSMWALVPRPGLSIAVTTLTTLAYDRAQAERLFPVSVCEVLRMNDVVRSSLAPGLDNILFLPTRFNASTTGSSLTNTQGGRYAVLLAALARLGADKPAPGLSVLNVLRSDARDGIIDGRIDGRPLVVQPPMYTNFIAALRPNIRRVVVDYGSRGLLQSLSELNPVARNIGGRFVKDECSPDVPPPPPPPPTGGTGGTGGTGSGGGGL